MKILIGILTAIFISLTTNTVSAQTTAFNYQGRLTDGGVAANGAFQMQFRLFDALSDGGQIGATLADVPVTATNGVFSVKLDFGANALSGANRWLEIAVRRNAGESYTTLSPREQIASSPYAVRTLSAANADNALNLGGIPASEYVTNANVGSSFIRNGTTLQTGNFNISGNGLIGGLVGLGTGVNGNFRLDSFGAIRSFSNVSTHFIAETTTTSANAWARFYMRTPNRSWFIGTSQAFNGDQFYLVDETALGGVGQSRMSIQPNGGAVAFPFGNVGIGTTNPSSGLELRGTGLGTQQRITDNTSGNSLVFQSGAGANMKVTGYNYDSNTAVPLHLSVDGANTVVGGNITQVQAGLGLPKAMIWVNPNHLIAKCYNGMTGVSATNAGQNGCGFTVTAISSFDNRIDFGFPVNNSFFSLVIKGSSLSTGGVFTFGESQQVQTVNQIIVSTNDVRGVHVIVY